MLPIRIMTRDFELLDEITKFESLQLKRSWHGIGSIDLVINRYARGADKLQKGCIIFPHNKLNKAYVIRHKEIELDQRGKVTENWLIKALPLKSWMGQRITYPPAHTANDNKQADAETVMQHYVINNVTNPVDASRKMEGIVLAANQARGETISWQSRYKNLAEELTEISLQSGLGWNIEVDFDQRAFIFMVEEGRDLTAHQRLLPPAIFSPEFNTIGQLSYMESDLNYRNYAVVGGQGEGVERRIIHVGDSSGFDRHELFVDARDIEEEIRQEDGSEAKPRPVPEIVADLQNRGEQKLKEYEQETYLEGQILTKSRLEYEKDWDLGDVVTLQNRKWGVTLDARITEVNEIYERQHGRKIEVVFGHNRPTLIGKIKQELAGMRNEVVR